MAQQLAAQDADIGCDLASRFARVETLEVPVLPARRGEPDLVILAPHA